MTYRIYVKLSPDSGAPNVAPVGSADTFDEATAMAIFHAGFSLADSLRIKGYTFEQISADPEVTEARRRDKTFAEQDDGTWAATIGGFSYVIWKEVSSPSTHARAS